MRCIAENAVLQARVVVAAAAGVDQAGGQIAAVLEEVVVVAVVVLTIGVLWCEAAAGPQELLLVSADWACWRGA
jgi:hypothetical protein